MNGVAATGDRHCRIEHERDLIVNSRYQFKLQMKNTDSKFELQKKKSFPEMLPQFCADRWLPAWEIFNLESTPPGLISVDIRFLHFASAWIWIFVLRFSNWEIRRLKRCSEVSEDFQRIK